MTDKPGATPPMSADKQRLFELLLEKKGLKAGSASALGRIPRRSDNHRLPLSYAQQRLWFLHEFSPDSAAYVFCNIVHLTGDLDRTALRNAYQHIVDRHEIFRTAFPQKDGVPFQRIEPQLGLDMPHVDLRDLPPGRKQEQLRQIAREDAQRPFQIDVAPLLRVTTVQLSDTRHAVIQTMHHIVYDGWSLALLFDELKTLYEQAAHGGSDPLPPLDIQYADFAIWQRRYLESHALRDQLEAWRETLAGHLPVLELPADHPRPPGQSYAGALHRIQLPAALTASLHALARQADCTLFMVLLAGFKILLHRYTGISDILVGTPIANRNHPQIENLIGFFVNSLVLRTSIEGDPDTLELLSRVRAATSKAYSNQDLPFERLVDELRPQRDLSHNPLFQVMFALQNTPDVPSRIGAAALSLEEVDNGTSLFDLTLNLYESRDGIYGYIEYCSDLFEPQTIARMAGHYQTLLQAMAAEPRRSISRLPLITRPERRQLLVDWNDTSVEFPDHLCIHQLIEMQAQRQPQALAVRHGDTEFSYAELNARADRLARRLTQRGVAADDIVAICLERSVEMLVGILGILKAGGAYLPLDPGYPAERLAFMLEDSGAGILLTRSGQLSDLPELKAVTVCLDEPVEEIDTGTVEASKAAVQPHHLAYVIYTSGSTGRPKGVMVTHRNLVHSTCARMDYYPKAVKRFLLLSSFSFDSSVAGIFWTLCQGGELHLPDAGAEQDIQEIARLVARSKATHMLSLPSVYGLLLSLATADQLESLNTVIVAGESCTTELVEQHRACLPATGLYNEYGPTEATVWSSVYRIRGSGGGHTVPIGRPINNVRIYLLDRSLQPVPVGIPGEIYIGGAGVARGYLHRDELTAERFVADPFSDALDARLYRSGDLARYRADGDIEFLGRADHQLKIRGYRIEPGEVESALSRHPAIREAVVIAKKTAPEAPTPSQESLLDLFDSGDIDPDDTETIDQTLLMMDTGDAEALLREIEAMSEDSAEQQLAAQTP